MYQFHPYQDDFQFIDDPGDTLKRKWPFEEDDSIYSPISSTNPAGAFEGASVEVIEEATEGESNPQQLVRVKTQLQGSGFLDGFSLDSRSSQSFQVRQEGRFFSLQHNGGNFARLNKLISGDLSELLQEFPMVRLKAFLSRKDLEIGSESWRPGNAITVEINIYGPEAESETIGKKLSKSGNFLQQPRFGAGGMKYVNPHILRMPGFSTDHEILDLDSDTGEDQVLESPGGNDDSNEDPIDVEQILDSQLQHILTTNISIDRRVKSPLLQHQKEAIDFISQREKGAADLEGLWKYNDTDEDEPFYQHVLNGERRREPDHAKGGIVADEMGLGKSLVILSVIAGSLDEARRFGAQKSPQQTRTPSKATLIIVPSTFLIDNWIKEIQRHIFSATLFSHQHIGWERHAEEELLKEKDIVFTTYATLAAEASRKDRGESILTTIEWFRIVLDEAHFVRNRSTKQFQAVMRLSAQYYWCLTGTPIQNDIEDLGALVAFVRVPILQRPAAFRKLISSPISLNVKDRFNNLQTLLRSICIRRTRELLNIPEPIEIRKPLTMAPAECEQYRELFLRCKMRIEMVVSGHRKGRFNSTILELFLALRLFCNNGKAEEGAPKDMDEALSLLQQQDQDHCVYCGCTILHLSEAPETDGGIMIPTCSHIVCHGCLIQYTMENQQCPSCGPSTIQSQTTDATRYQLARPLGEPTARPFAHYSTKLRALLFDIMQNPSQKCIVFSSWKKSLTLVAEMLTSQGIAYSMIDGSLPLSRRIAELKTYEEPDTNVLLMTLGTGAVGQVNPLNITSSSCIYLLEPQWNPSIEDQAIGRALRLGQLSRVTIVRYIMIGTVEETHVVPRQRKKLQIAGGGFQKENNRNADRLKSLRNLFDVDSMVQDPRTLN
ncbi:uncharacterized protein N7484_000197 [Penicillium longicatenatum]|uniref:uncharacterized protein n=1 Tax=Penicillium longicatenatum TaxID=1561947 RepID=UPI002548F00B|nr:uncharacterized protein N7484_000197 [Penicillium longicatenatum]KAJ5660825.1 hypothetical protein N7484_000197 [Penicillium longicatenatum]